MDPVRPQVSPYTVKQFAHGELAKDSGSYVVDLIVELPDSVVHHHLGGGASDMSRQFRARYEIGQAGELAVYSLGVDPNSGRPDEPVKHIITYSPHGWRSVQGTALGQKPKDPQSML